MSRDTRPRCLKTGHCQAHQPKAPAQNPYASILAIRVITHSACLVPVTSDALRAAWPLGCLARRPILASARSLSVWAISRWRWSLLGLGGAAASRLVGDSRCRHVPGHRAVHDPGLCGPWPDARGRPAHRPRACLAARDDPPMAQPATTPCPEHKAIRITEIIPALRATSCACDPPTDPRHTSAS